MVKIAARGPNSSRESSTGFEIENQGKIDIYLRLQAAEDVKLLNLLSKSCTQILAYPSFAMLESMRISANPSEVGRSV